MSRDDCVALPHSAVGLSAVCDVVFPDHTHLLFRTTMTPQHLVTFLFFLFFLSLVFKLYLLIYIFYSFLHL